MVDAEWVKCVNEAHAGQLAKDDCKAADKSYWHLTVTPTDTTKRNADYGLSEEEAEAAVGQVFEKWLSYHSGGVTVRDPFYCCQRNRAPPPAFPRTPNHGQHK